MEEPCSCYPTDLDDPQWQFIGPLIPPSKPVGAERVTSMRCVVNAILYRRRAGCAWRMLPHDFPHWRTVYGYFRQWQADGTWCEVDGALRRLVHQDPRAINDSAPPPAEISPACSWPVPQIREERFQTGEKIRKNPAEGRPQIEV